MREGPGASKERRVIHRILRRADVW